MPSGNTHDAITFILAAPAAVVTYYATDSFAAAAIVTAAFIFGGLMFGPDLDVASKQYSRWMFFRFLWFPYRSFFKHRSRWTHGLIFGTLFRVVYFMGVVTIILFASSYCSAIFFRTEMPQPADLAEAWRAAGSLLRLHAGGYMLLLVFAGMWTGAASHTFADMAGTYIKTGRSGGFL
ncbi:MAG: metal-binding protein [Acidobacteriota bacterium]